MVNITEEHFSENGIIFSGLFVSHKEDFIDFFEKYYQTQSTDIEVVSNALLQFLNQISISSKTITVAQGNNFKFLWKEFQKKVLLNENNELQLLVMYRDSSNHGRFGSVSTIINQSEVEKSGKDRRGKSSFGIQSGDKLVSDTMAMIKAQDVERFLQEHLNLYLEELDQQIGQSNAEILTSDSVKSYLINRFQNIDPMVLGQMHWRDAFFTGAGDGNKNYFFSGQGLGQAYDAFMNHVANYEKYVYNYLSSSGKVSGQMTEHEKSLSKQSIMQQEGSIANYAKLLYGGRNSVSWFTGGDIVIVNPETGQVVYNIQLKTTTEKNRSTFLIKITKLKEFIDQFVNADSPRKKAEVLFQHLQTTVSNSAEFNSAAAESMRNVVKEQLFKRIK